MKAAGTLYLVATPIGTLEDITFRAARVLAQVDFIACEDTRKSGILLKHLQISKPLVSYHEFNERLVSDRIISRVVAGENAAVICDAGTPAVSDPGFTVVREAVAKRVQVVAVPGPTAMITALSVSGLPTDAFIFYGFLPPKVGKRRRILESLRDRRETLIFYESPHRIHKLIAEIQAVIGNRRVALCRELTKKFEEVMRADIATLSRELDERKLKGEITLVVEGLVRSKSGREQEGGQ
jgi:16S rRNA (cytidine1402-2'-O)-methyltransferase